MIKQNPIVYNKLKLLIDRILLADCPSEPYTSILATGYGTPISSGPWDTAWGSSPCEYAKMQPIIAEINALQNTWGKGIINMVIVTNVPEQGETTITLLESAIVMRWVGLVAQLLMLGANPNLTTANVPFLVQLSQAEATVDAFTPNIVADQAIIGLLLRSGAYVPPGYPGTHGYGIDRPFPGQRFRDNAFPCVDRPNILKF